MSTTQVRDEFVDEFVDEFADETVDEIVDEFVLNLEKMAKYYSGKVLRTVVTARKKQKKHNTDSVLLSTQKSTEINFN